MHTTVKMKLTSLSWGTLVSWTNSVCVVTLICMVPNVTGHPQCMNGDPPFKASSQLALCSDYAEAGCCSPEAERSIVQLYEHVKHRLAPDDWTRCKDYTKELLCAKCSPFSAHVFDVEMSANSTRKLPGLCTNYCNHFYTTCRDVLWFIDEDLAASSVFGSKTRFCEHARISDMDYCYPAVSDRDETMESQPANTTQGCLCLEPIVTNLSLPLYARHSGDDTGRMFVAEQRGFVYIVYPDTKKCLPTPFLDISHKVLLRIFSKGDERGLNGLAFHPDFANNGRFFLHFNVPLKSQHELTEKEKSFGIRYDHKTRIVEMRVSDSDPNVADPNSAKVLLEVNEPFANHNGGEMFFLDGYLYLFFGDGGGAGDSLNQSQDLSSLLGKVLRLDVDTPPSDDKAYSIPSDNPFIGQEGARPEIFAYGIRNIWRCGVDTGDRKTGAGKGRVLCGDVGQSLYEEVDLLKKGANYGWRAREGNECYDKVMCQNLDPKDLEFPVHVYDHSVGKSVTGGQFYRGCDSPSLNGKYLYGDYAVGRLFSLEETSSGNWVNNDVTMCGADVCKDGLTNHVDLYITSFGLDQNGEVYVLSTPSSMPRLRDGGLYKFVDPFSKPQGRCDGQR